MFLVMGFGGAPTSSAPANPEKPIPSTPTTTKMFFTILTLFMFTASVVVIRPRRQFLSGHPWVGNLLVTLLVAQSQLEDHAVPEPVEHQFDHHVGEPVDDHGQQDALGGSHQIGEHHAAEEGESESSKERHQGSGLAFQHRLDRHVVDHSKQQGLRNRHPVPGHLWEQGHRQSKHQAPEKGLFVDDAAKLGQDFVQQGTAIQRLPFDRAVQDQQGGSQKERNIHGHQGPEVRCGHIIPVGHRHQECEEGCGDVVQFHFFDFDREEAVHQHQNGNADHHVFGDHLFVWGHAPPWKKQGGFDPTLPELV